MLRKSSLLSLFLLVSAFCLAQQSRRFTFDYTFAVRVTDPGQPLEVWFPVATSDQYQQVRILSKTGDLPLEETREPEYGNRMFHASTEKADKAEYHFSVKYEVDRREHFMAAAHGNVSGGSMRRFLEPDKLVPTTGLPAEIAAKQVKPGMSEMEKGRALYDYTLANMRYDKSGTGWGYGDTLWACDAKRGNCTDFHSLFISMARSQGIPGKFEIGFPLPADKNASEIPGYHCWAEFYTKERGWVPVDISEAWKHQDKRDYFFGAHDVNRVQFSVGRDIELSPRQKGERLNYFVYPYVELGGKEYSNVANAFSFAEAGAAQQSAGKGK
jgi:transglutaminase-like putative cysteine protease